MKSQIFLEEKDLDAFKEAFNVKALTFNALQTTTPSLMMIELPGILLTIDGIERLAKAGVIFCGNKETYDDEKVFASNGKEYSIVMAHNHQPVAHIQRDGTPPEEEQEEIKRFWKIMDKNH